MNDIEIAIQALMKADELDIFEGPIPDDSINRVKELVDFELPDDYLLFLKRCGFASWVGHSVFGVYDESDNRFPKSYNYSVVTQTRRARSALLGSYKGIDQSIVIGKDGMGGYFLLSSGDSRVIWINFDEEWVQTRTFNSFTEYLIYQLSN